jgi:hypothetical protein
MSVTEDETPAQQAQRLELERTCASIGRIINAAVMDASRSAGHRLGFTFLMFDFGAKGSLAYLSNANREDMIRLLTEAVQTLKEHTQ